MDMVEQPRADWHFCLGLLIERRPIAGVTGSKGRTVELSADPIEEASGWEPGAAREMHGSRRISERPNGRSSARVHRVGVMNLHGSIALNLVHLLADMNRYDRSGRFVSGHDQHGA